MMLRTWAALILAAAAVAQEPIEDPRRAPSTALHRAWMLEVLDLEPVAAANVYAEVIADRRRWNLSRWIAAARLTELQRLDVAGGTRVDASEAPLELQQLFEAADNTLELDPLIERVTCEPSEVLAELSTEEGRLPPLRPLVAAAEFWVVNQIGPSRLDQFRRRRAEWDNRPAFTSRVFAARVLYAELQDRPQDADERRSLYFPSWSSPPSTGTHEDQLARIRHNLGKLVGEREWAGAWQRLHRRLRDTVDRIAEGDPAAAIALVRRLPQYAERLLAPVPEEDR